MIRLKITKLPRFSGNLAYPIILAAYGLVMGTIMMFAIQFLYTALHAPFDDLQQNNEEIVTRLNRDALMRLEKKSSL